MKKSIYTLMLPLCLAAMLFCGCDDFVETDAPNSQLVTSAVFENMTTANAAMADVYSQMRENGLISGKPYGFSCLLGTYTDELISYESGEYTSGDFYNNALLPSNEYIGLLWNASYNQVYACNAILKGAGESTALTAAQKNQLQGEALFVRALIHFNINNVFGDIPYVEATDYVQNSTVTRTPTVTVYQNVIRDLERAIELLPQDYLTTDRIRPNKATAKALLARVYLYHEMNAEASNMASAVLNDTERYRNEPDLDKVFLKNSPATIWQLAAGAAGGNTDDAITFIFYSGPPYIAGLSETFVNQFEAGDLRKQHWIGTVTEGTTSWYYPYKYKEDLATASSMEYTIVFRLAEQYLIRAEARARQGELLGAKEDLNIIRHIAGLADTTAQTQAELLDAILQERRSELFTEQGHRFFDLKRFGKLDAALGTKAGWNATDVLWPLPQAELLVNRFLTPQNPGY